MVEKECLNIVLGYLSWIDNTSVTATKLSYFYLFDQSSEWDMTLIFIGIVAAVMWLICSIIYVAAFFYEYHQTKEVDFTTEKEFHSVEDEEGRAAVVPTEYKSSDVSVESSSVEYVGDTEAGPNIPDPAPEEIKPQQRRFSEVSV